MDTHRLEKLKDSIDAAIRSGSPEDTAGLAAEMEAVLAEIKPDSPPQGDQAEHVVRLIRDVWYASAEPPADLPGDPQQQADLAELLDSMLATQRFALALARGDLSQSLSVRGAMAASLKSLHASLRHLTWQTEMIAQGDFSQKVEFMGEFSTAFNAMVSSLAAAREQIHDQKEALERINASLMEEISRRRQATERTEIQRRLMEHREQERLQLARDLHDGPLQDVIALLFMVNTLLRMPLEPPVQQQLLAAKEVIDQVIDELRDFSGELRPPALSKLGLKEAIAAHANSTMKKYPGLAIELSLHYEDRSLPEAALIALYRIYQESLNNVIKHARAGRVKVVLQSDSSQVRMQIDDDGVGFVLPDDWLELVRESHLGLVGIRERAESIGGRVEIWSQPQQGTCIEVIVPVKK